MVLTAQSEPPHRITGSDGVHIAETSSVRNRNGGTVHNGVGGACGLGRGTALVSPAAMASCLARCDGRRDWSADGLARTLGPARQWRRNRPVGQRRRSGSRVDRGDGSPIEGRGPDRHRAAVRGCAGCRHRDGADLVGAGAHQLPRGRRRGHDQRHDRRDRQDLFGHGGRQRSRPTTSPCCS